MIRVIYIAEGREPCERRIRRSSDLDRFLGLSLTAARVEYDVWSVNKKLLNNVEDFLRVRLGREPDLEPIS